jgi:hypothetical protein
MEVALAAGGLDQIEKVYAYNTAELQNLLITHAHLGIKQLIWMVDRNCWMKFGKYIPYAHRLRIHLNLSRNGSRQ